MYGLLKPECQATWLEMAAAEAEVDIPAGAVMGIALAAAAAAAAAAATSTATATVMLLRLLLRMLLMLQVLQALVVLDDGAHSGSSHRSERVHADTFQSRLIHKRMPLSRHQQASYP